MSDECSEHYTVESDKSKACPQCGSGTLNDVVDPEGTALGISFLDRERAEDMARDLSWAFEKGRQTGDAIHRVLAERARCAAIVRAKKPPRGSLSWWICDELEMIAQEIERGDANSPS